MKKNKYLSFYNKSSWKYLIKNPAFILWVVCFCACQKEGSISLENTKDELGVELSDSTTVLTSTYQLDALPSNGKGLMLVGTLNDSETGRLAISSYFRISNSGLSSVSIPDDAVLDSLSLEMPYQGYYYGDTMVTQQVSLHRLNEAIELVEESVAWEDDEQPVFASGAALFTNNAFDYERTPIGTTSFRPKPNTKTDTVFIKMDKAFGQELWQKIKNKENQVTNTDEFLDYFKGLVLVPEGNTDIITAFPTDSVALGLHYSYTRSTDGKLVQSSIKLLMDDSTYQFNSIMVDRSNSTLKGLSASAVGEIAAVSTDGKVMLQGLSGLVTKIQFPYLYEFVNRNDIIINKAELSIEIAPDSRTTYAAPGSLNMLLADQYGIPKSLLNYSWQTYTQTPTLQKSADGGAKNDRYTFDLTEYVSNFRKAVEDKKSALYISLPVSDLLSKVDRLLVASDDGRPLIKLRLWYTQY